MKIKFFCYLWRHTGSWDHETKEFRRLIHSIYITMFCEKHFFINQKQQSRPSQMIFQSSSCDQPCSQEITKPITHGHFLSSLLSLPAERASRQEAISLTHLQYWLWILRVNATCNRHANRNVCMLTEPEDWGRWGRSTAALDRQISSLNCVSGEN